MDVKRIAFARGFAACGLALSAALTVTPAPAQAPNASQIGAFKDWGVYTAPAAKGKTCFVGSKPAESELDPKPKKPVERGPVYLFITTRTARRASSMPCARAPSSS